MHLRDWFKGFPGIWMLHTPWYDGFLDDEGKPNLFVSKPGKWQFHWEKWWPTDQPKEPAAWAELLRAPVVAAGAPLTSNEAPGAAWRFGWCDAIQVVGLGPKASDFDDSSSSHWHDLKWPTWKILGYHLFRYTSSRRCFHNRLQWWVVKGQMVFPFCLPEVAPNWAEDTKRFLQLHQKSLRVRTCIKCVCMYIYIYMYVYIHVHAYVHVNVHIYMYICICRCKCACRSTYAYA